MPERGEPRRGQTTNFRKLDDGKLKSFLLELLRQRYAEHVKEEIDNGPDESDFIEAFNAAMEDDPRTYLNESIPDDQIMLTHRDLDTILIKMGWINYDISK